MWSEADRQRAPVGDFPPRWASAWGDDVYGLWADLAVGGVVQRLRWIEPGVLTTNSTPAGWRHAEVGDENKRWLIGRLAPSHDLVVDPGFWLSDTACTQALWEVVMGSIDPLPLHQGVNSNQSVAIRISWNSALRFIQELQKSLPTGVRAMLPKMEQWEYSARAGARSEDSWGDAPSTPDLQAVDGTAAGLLAKGFPPNAWGLYHARIDELLSDQMIVFGTWVQLAPNGASGSDCITGRKYWGWVTPGTRMFPFDSIHLGYPGGPIHGVRFLLRTLAGKP